MEKIEYTLTRKKIKRLNLRVKSDGMVYVSAPLRTPQNEIDKFVTSCKEMILEAQERFKATKEERNRLYPKLQLVEGEKVLLLGKFYPLRIQEVDTVKKERTWFDGQNVTIYIMPGHSYEKRKKLFDKMWRLYCEHIFKKLIVPIQQKFLDSPYGFNNKAKVSLLELRIRDMKSRWGSCMPQRKIITLNSRLLSFPEAYIEYVIVHEFAHFVEANHSSRFHAVVTYFLPQWQKIKSALNYEGSLIYG